MAQPAILVGTPAYGGQLTLRFFRSYLKLERALAKAGVGLDIATVGNESLIPRARNRIVAEFIGRPEFSHLLFIDADIGFDAATVLGLLEYGKPVTGVACPMKNFYWDEVHALARKAADGASLKSAAHHYAVNMLPGKFEIDRGFLEVAAVGTGFMMVQREVFGTLQARHPELKYRNDVKGYDTDATRGNFWLFFDTLHDRESGRYLSEDYAFCRRWRDAGGSIYCDIGSRLTHFGNYAFEGSLLAKMQVEKSG